MRKPFMYAIVVLGLFLTGSIALAQDSSTSAEATAVFCGDLAESDCTILQQSAEAMSNLSSATFNFDFQMTFSGMEEGGPQNLSVTGDGAFSGRPPGTEMQPGNPAAMFSAMGDALRAFKAELGLTVNLPPMMLTEMQADAAGELPETIDLEVRLVDGVGYLNADTFRPFLEGIMGDESPAALAALNGWVSLDLVTFLSDVLAENPEIMSQFSMGMMNSQSSSIFSNPSAFSSAVTIERDADTDGAATFITTLDFAVLATDPAFMEMMRSQIEASGETVTDEQLQASLAIMGAMGDAITFTTTQTIDPSSGYVQSMTFDMNFNFSQMGMMGAAGTSEATEEATAFGFTMTGNVTLDNFNSAPDITAPEGATPLPPEVLEQLTVGMRGSVGGNAAGGGTSPAVEVPSVEIPTVVIPTIEIPTIEVPVIGATQTPSA